jgi:hypothetical protein
MPQNVVVAWKIDFQLPNLQIPISLQKKLHEINKYVILNIDC